LSRKRRSHGAPGEPLRASLATECAHCGRSLHLELDELGGLAVGETDAAPVLFEPAVDWERFSGKHIIDDF
jgi:hypothetical protein